MHPLDKKVKDAFVEGGINSTEGTAMTPTEIAGHFNLPVHVDKEPEKDSIYSINARVKNATRDSCGGSLTSTGEILCNSVSHLIKSLHKLKSGLSGEKLEEVEKLIEAAQALPGSVINAAKVNLPRKK